MNITDIRKKNITKARDSSNATNRLKGLRTFIRSKTKKSSIKNDIIDDLIKTKYYEYIYNIWLDSNDVEDDGLSIKDMDLLCMFDFVPPEELKSKYDGLFITEIPINAFK